MFITNLRENTELADVARLFYGDEFPLISIGETDGKFTVKLDVAEYVFEYSDEAYDIIPSEHRLKRLSKIAVYDALMQFTGKHMAWGALTGVRPSKLFYECIGRGQTNEQAVETMRKVYRISKKRAMILKRIIEAQRGKIYYPSDYINLYIHIPYCTTRCTYCSFVSLPISKNTEQSHDYVDLLRDEILKSVDYLESRGKKILSVYIGGGTPTALDERSFEKILSAIDAKDCEFTCEAGRPDTVTLEKIDIMKRFGVTRVCVNPQTLNDPTLALIGRNHSVDDFFRVYENVKKMNFDINCDLIAGLGNETVDDFKFSLDGILRLKPQNITVHSLAKKNGSAIRYDNGENGNTAAMIEYALNNTVGYAPYYLYRQKRQAGNLENVGFALPGKECVNNITTMEETVGVMACGAGAISKIAENDNISRFANMRDVPLYISRYAEKLDAKLRFFDACY